MKCWLLTIGEPLPTDPGHPRLLRAGLLSQVLADRGHDVVWWSSAFDHVSKSFRTLSESNLSVDSRQSIVLLNGGGYRRNVSLARMRDHSRLARRFEERSVREARPDVILASLPSIELALTGVRYGRQSGVPVVVDVRDLWPDAMVDLLPAVLQPIGRAVTSGMRRQVRACCKGASAIIGNSRMFVDWGLHHAGRSATTLDRVFPHGYPVATISAREYEGARQSLAATGVDLSAGRTTALFLGTIGKQFDLDPVFEAARLLQSDSRMQFVIAGAGERLDHYRRAAESLPNVVMPGWIDGPAIRLLLEHASVGLLAYADRKHWIESTPNKFAEYLSAGLPVLISLDRGEMLNQALTGGYGMSYAHSGARMAAAIRELADRPARTAAMRAAALGSFERTFRADAVYGALAEYLEVVGAP